MMHSQARSTSRARTSPTSLGILATACSRSAALLMAAAVAVALAGQVAAQTTAPGGFTSSGDFRRHRGQKTEDSGSQVASTLDAAESLVARAHFLSHMFARNCAPNSMPIAATRPRCGVIRADWLDWACRASS